MNFLFLFGLVFLSGCLHRNDIKNKESKASKVEINHNEGGAFVTPSQDLKALRLQSFDIKKADINVTQKISAKNIQARLIDIPIALAASSFTESLDSNNNRHVTYTSAQSYDDVFSFYKNDLVRFGWVIIVFYTDKNFSVIYAKKPHKHAVFSLKNSKHFWNASASVLVEIVVSYV